MREINIRPVYFNVGMILLWGVFWGVGGELD